jgi:hypothetical protein
MSAKARHVTSAVALAIAALVLMLSACTGDSPTAPFDDKTCWEIDGQIYCK